MESRGFSFPPPPPPPPPQQLQAPGFRVGGSYGQNTANYGSRGGRGSGYHRGRGRGSGNRGGRGGHFGSIDSGYAAPYHDNPSTNYGRYSPATTLSSPSPVTGAPSYHNSSQFSRPPTQPSYPSGRPYPQAATQLPSYPSHPNYDAGYNTSHKVPAPPQSVGGYVPAISPPPQGHSSSPPSHGPQGLPGPPALMAPPIHWGYDNAGTGGFYAGSSKASTPNSLSRPNPGYTNAHSNPHHGGGNSAKNGHKRPFSSAFERLDSTVPRTPAPPPVPSFGNPLPAKPPAPLDTARKAPKKKKRRFNQLGLTPKTDEQVSSEEEDDVDEEARLAAVSGGTGPLQFTYRGRTATLQSPVEIAAWIQERKQRFPTQARIEEKKKTMAEAKRQQEKQKEEARRHQKTQKEGAKLDRKDEREQNSNAIDAALKAKIKAEKLRKRLIKEEKRVAKAEADAERAQLEAEALQQSPAVKLDDVTVESPAENTVLRVVNSIQPESDAAHPILDPSTPLSASSPLLSDVNDPESSGSDLSSDSADDSDGDSAPEEVSSRRDGPGRVPAPPREKKKRPCRFFVRTGRCPQGDRCRFAHELPEGSANKVRSSDTKTRGQPAKKGLFQLLMAREMEEKDRRVMQAIVLLGEQGLLEEPICETTPWVATDRVSPPVVQGVDAVGMGMTDDAKG